MSVLADSLVGSAVEQTLDDFDRGCSDALDLVAAAGIGKTRLLHEPAAHAELRGQRARSGSASELERGPPSSALVEALDEYLESFDRDGSSASAHWPERPAQSNRWSSRPTTLHRPRNGRSHE